MEANNLKIAEGEKLYLDGVELKHVSLRWWVSGAYSCDCGYGEPVWRYGS